jgi:hypothetical protein
LIDIGEIILCGKSVGMVLAEDTFAVSQSPLAKSDCFIEPACDSVGRGQVDPGFKGVRMVLTENALPVSKGLFVQRDGLGCSPRDLVGAT